MQYASTALLNGFETVVVLLPLNVVPGFDPDPPPQNDTYGVPDEVQVGWVKNESGEFVPPSAPTKPPVPPVPQSVSSRQAKHALLDAGLYLQVEEIINSMEGTEGISARIEWLAPTFQRNSAFLNQMALTLGLTQEQLDGLFVKAATYE